MDCQFLVFVNHVFLTAFNVSEFDALRLSNLEEILFQVSLIILSLSSLFFSDKWNIMIIFYAYVNFLFCFKSNQAMHCCKRNRHYAINNNNCASEFYFFGCRISLLLFACHVFCTAGLHVTFNFDLPLSSFQLVVKKADLLRPLCSLFSNLKQLDFSKLESTLLSFSYANNCRWSVFSCHSREVWNMFYLI